MTVPGALVPVMLCLVTNQEQNQIIVQMHLHRQLIEQVLVVLSLHLQVDMM